MIRIGCEKEPWDFAENDVSDLRLAVIEVGLAKVAIDADAAVSSARH